MSILYTNKEIIELTPTETFWELLVSSKDNPGYTKEFTLNNSGYYLIDREGIGSYESELEKVFTKAFEQELEESGIPKLSWPNTKDIAVFKGHFKIKAKPLIADLGINPLQTGKVNA